MNPYSPYVGVALLLGILGFRWALDRSRMRRFQHNLQRAQDATARSDWPAAEAALRICVKIAPVAAPVRRMLGGMLARRGKLKEAEEQLRFAVDLEPRNAAGHLDLGLFLALCVADRTDDAFDSLRRAIGYNPDLRRELAAEPKLSPLRNHPRFRELFEPHP